MKPRTEPFGTPEELVEFVRRSLDGYLDRNGKVFYSGFPTYRQGHVVFLGYNPGGCGHYTLREYISTTQIPSRPYNEYVDNPWGKNHQPNRLQVHTQRLFRGLGLDLKTEVFTSNLYFWNTPSIAETRTPEFQHFKPVCWEVLRHFLTAVPGRMVICNGNQTFYELLYWLSPARSQDRSTYRELESELFGKRGKVLQAFRELDGRTLGIIGLPHLSWVDVSKNERAVQLIRAAIDALSSAPTGSAEQ